jgi:hypothetical protein
MPLLGSNDKCNNSHQNSGEYRCLCGVPSIWSGSRAAFYFDVLATNTFTCIIGEKLWFSPGSSASDPSICNIIHPGVRTVPKVGVYTSRLGLIVQGNQNRTKKYSICLSSPKKMIYHSSVSFRMIQMCFI